MTDNPNNGSDPIDPYARAAAAALESTALLGNEIHSLLAAEDALTEQLEQLLSESKTRGKRLRGAFRELTSEPTRGRPPTPRVQNPTSEHNRVSGDKVLAVLDYVQQAGTPVTVRMVSDSLGVSDFVARGALLQLRDSESVRRVGGTGGPGGGYRYAVMPGNGEGEMSPRGDTTSLEQVSGETQPIRPGYRGATQVRDEIVAWARERPDDTFTAAEVASAIGITTVGLGPQMRVLVTRERLESVGIDEIAAGKQVTVYKLGARA